MNLLDKIKLLMKEKNIKNIRQLSEMSDVPYSTIDSLFKKGYEGVRLSTMTKLCSVLGCTLDFLMTDGIDENINIDQQQIIDDYNKLDIRQKQTIKEIIKGQLGIASNLRVKALKLFNQSACAGNGNYIDDDSYSIVDFQNPPINASFAVKIQGKSMQPIINDGDIVFIQPNVNLQNGDIGIFTYNGETYCKKLHHSQKGLVLQSINPEYKDITIYSQEELFIVGRVL